MVLMSGMMKMMMTMLGVRQRWRVWVMLGWVVGRVGVGLSIWIRRMKTGAIGTEGAQSLYYMNN
jgi:hypothetical protein